jgi:hypothetical protein
MSPRISLGIFGALVGQLLLSARSPAQSCSRTFGPMNGEIRVSQSISYDQIWPQVARGAAGWNFAWSQGQDVWARRFDFQLNPVSSQFLVNTVNGVGIQDEPAICNGTSGNFIVSWSERNGYDGSGMGVYARVYASNGSPVSSEILVNSIQFASQWRPLIAPTPSGGWVVAWSGDSDGNSYFKILNSTGGPLSGDVRANTYTFDAQVDPAVAVAPNGTIFVAFVDYSGHGGVGTGTNLYGRTFDSLGNALQAQEFLLTSLDSNGNQRDPRVVSDGFGRFFVVFENQVGDGSGYGISARVFNSAGAPLVYEFPVNSTTQGDQRQGRIAIDSQGRSLFTWVDFSAGFGSAKIRARQFNGQANPLGPDFIINENPDVGVSLPSPAMDASGRDIVIGFQGPGSPGQGLDVYAKRFASTTGMQVYCAAKFNSLGCYPSIGGNGGPSASSPSPFWITASNVLNQKPALLLYGYGSSFAPYYGATICIAPPLRSLPFQNTGGNPSPTDCSGALSTNFNARIQSGADPNLIPGVTVSARWYYRDPQDPTGYSSGFTDAIRFTICP